MFPNIFINNCSISILEIALFSGDVVIKLSPKVCECIIESVLLEGVRKEDLSISACMQIVIIKKEILQMLNKNLKIK